MATLHYKVFVRLSFALCFVFSAMWAETKFVSGYNDGVSVYVTIESNGHTYKTSDVGPATNAKLWNLLNAEDKKKVLHYYYLPGYRSTDFGPTATDMAKWANDTQGWTALIKALKQKRANKSYPTLKAFYSKPLKMPASQGDGQCTEQIANSQLAKEVKALSMDINGNYRLGKQLYNKLIDIKWNQISAAVKGISSNLIPIIVDNFMTSFITNGASQMSQAIANLYSFAKSTIDSAKNKPNDAAELIKRLDILCDMMETDAKTAQKLVEQDMEKFKSKSKELARLCKEDYKAKMKFEKEKKAAHLKDIGSLAIDTGLKITSKAKTREEREAEIRKKAENLLRQLYNSLYEVEKKAHNSYQELSEKYKYIRNPKNPKFCGNKSTTYDLKSKTTQTAYYFKMPVSANDPCFSMPTPVKEIKEWKTDFPRYINAQKEYLEMSKEILENTKNSYQSTLKKLSLIQGKINEVINKYKRYLQGFYRPDYSVGKDIEYFNVLIQIVEKNISSAKIRLQGAETGNSIIAKGLEKRIEREKSLIGPYSSLEDNFVNSLIQIRDAIARIDRIYKSYGFIDVQHHYPTLNSVKLNHLLPSSHTREKKIDDIIKKLKKDQIEIRHQIKRLITGQNNAADDLALLNQFLTSYTKVGPNFPLSVKKDVKEVTGITIKSPYYDIVKDWSNGDPMLWMQGSKGEWIIKPNRLLLNINSIISKLHGGSDIYAKLDAIYKIIAKNETQYLSMDSSAWSKTFNKFSSNVYSILQANRGLKSKKTNDLVAKIYNLLYKIDTVVSNRQRVSNALPVLQKDINDAQKLLLKKPNDILKYVAMIQNLQDDTREGSNAYSVKKSPVLAPLFIKINQLIIDLQATKSQIELNLENSKIEKIRDFYKQFKEAYESKDISSIIALLSDDWGSSSDGVDISDLEDYLGRSFRVFDEIQYNISNLSVHHFIRNIYKVSYNVNIEGEIYDDDIEHDEKSSVQEEVEIKNGKVKIAKTLNGRFWSIK